MHGIARKSLIVGLASGLALGSLVAGPPAGATAPAPVASTGITLGVGTPGAKVIAAGHLFVALTPYGTTHGTVVVRGLDGSDVGTVAGVDGATWLVGSADGERVYALSRVTRSIDVIDAEGATRVASYVLPDGCVPADLADLGPTVWFSYGLCGGDQDNPTGAGVGVIDFTADDPALAFVTRDLAWDPPRLGGDPSAPSSLIVTTDATRLTLQRYDVAGTTLTPAQTVTPPGCPEIGVVPVGPDGLLRLRCPTATTSEVWYHAGDLSAAGSLPAGSTLLHGLPGPDGLVAVARQYDSPGDPAPWTVYEADGRLRKSYTDVDSTGYPRGLLWGPDGELFGFDEVDPSGVITAQLHLLGSPSAYGTQLVLTFPHDAVPVTSTTVIRGSVLSTDADPAAKAGRVVSVARIRTSDHSSTALPSVTTTSTGTFTITDHPPVGYYEYRVSMAGDATHDGAESTTEPIAVSRGLPTLTVTVSPSSPRPGQVVTVRARLSSPLHNRVISVFAATAGHAGGSPRLIRSQAAAWDGSVTVTYRVLQPMQFIATTVADSTYLPGRAWTMARVAPDITLRQRGYYRTSGGYRLYHHRTDPRIGYQMNPWPDERGTPVEWTLQRYRAGHWSTIAVVRYPSQEESGIVVRASRVGKGTYRVRLGNLGNDEYSSRSVSAWTSFRIVT